MISILAACAALQPIDLADEVTAAPVEAGVWSEIEDIYAGDWQIPLNDGPTALAWRLRAIDSATASIDMQTFLWTFDTVGTEVMSRIINAADRGVLVKLLIDDSFLAGDDQILLSLQAHPNIEYRVYNPYKRRSSGLLSREILNLGEFQRIDHRMHNKAMIVDNQVAIIGGRNIADEYYGFDSGANFRDMELLVGGPVVQSAAQIFDDYWNDDWSFPIDRVARANTRAVAHSDTAAWRVDQSVFPYETQKERSSKWRKAVRSSFSGRAELIADKPPAKTPAAEADQPVQVANRIQQLVNEAKRDVTIVTAYLIPSPIILSSLKAAVERGVTVTILTNSIRSNNHLAAHAAYKNHIRALMSSGVGLHELRVDAPSRGRYITAPVADKSLALHAKYLIIDNDTVFIGSANIDPRSLRLNTEIGLIIRDRQLNKAIRNYTDPDLKTSNAWRLELTAESNLIWVGENEVLNAEPAASSAQRIEDWFFAHLPIEGEL